MEEKSKLNKNLKKELSILFILSFFIISAMVSYAFLGDLIFTGQKDHLITTCGFGLEMEEENPITLIDNVPISDVKASTYIPYSITLRKSNNTCGSIDFILNMKSLCANCTQINNQCVVGDNTCNCQANYQIESNIIKYSISDADDVLLASGTDPYNMNFSGSIDNLSEEVTYKIRMWISSSATNNDLYVKSEGSFLRNPDQTYVTRNFCSKLNINVNAS